MKKRNLRAKILISVSVIIFIVLGTTTLVHMYNIKRDYLEALSWRSEALARGLIDRATELAEDGLDEQAILGVLSLDCFKIYKENKENNIIHVGVINSSNIIMAHNERTLWETAVENQTLLHALEQQARAVVFDGAVYHALVPIMVLQDTLLGTIDIGIPKSAVDEKVWQSLKQAVGLFVFFLVTAFFAVSFLMHVLLTRPVRQLIIVGEQLAAGNLVQVSNLTAGREDEIATLGHMFNQIAVYLQHTAEVASHVATGVLDGEVQVRSKQDFLGKAMEEMLQYLRYIAEIATRIADGDLTRTVNVRSATDAFGRAIQSMTEGLRSLIVQIRTSADQIAATEKTISSLAAEDIHIVQEMYTSSDVMMSTLQQMGSSVEEVAHNMDVLSSSVEETLASVSQMSSSITHIAANTTDLTEQTHETIAYLDGTMRSLEEVVSNTDVSKRLSQETSQDALAGQEAVEELTVSMQTIQETITKAVESITQFARRSQDIDKILDVIRDITEQTSLLALNASIIAAQAGSHGRGFAVVADEIRNLATGVGTSTKDIAEIVHSLQQDTQRVAQTVHEGADDVKLGMERTQQAREKLEKILASAQRSSKVVTDIADTLHDLMAASQTVSVSMEQVNAMTDNITTATTQQEASTKQISQAVAYINEMASQIQHATTEQLNGIQHIFDSMEKITGLATQNLGSSQQITATAEDLSVQANLLLQSVDRFKLSTEE